MVIYTCLVAPFMEELLFRGVLLRKARRFGDRTAVVFTAVMFGLMHGNLNQFLYAVVIGLVLGYLAVRTNPDPLQCPAPYDSEFVFDAARDGGGRALCAGAFLGGSGVFVCQFSYGPAPSLRQGICFFFRDGRRYWWQMGQQNGVPTSYKNMCI